jgi:hypothetical protein
VEVCSGFVEEEGRNLPGLFVQNKPGTTMTGWIDKASGACIEAPRTRHASKMRSGGLAGHMRARAALIMSSDAVCCVSSFSLFAAYMAVQQDPVQP